MSSLSEFRIVSRRRYEAMEARLAELEKVAEAAVEVFDADQQGRNEPYDKRLSDGIDALEAPLRAAGYLGVGNE